MNTYLNLLKEILEEGVEKNDRTGVGTLSCFGKQLRFDLSKNFPLLTTKKVHLKSVIYELLWFLKGDTNIAYLNDHGVHIWDQWADKNGNLGPIYGKQWRSWSRDDGMVCDQIKELVTTISKDADSRRLIVSAWNVGELDKMSLAPCHCLFQFYVSNGKLSCQLYQRSADIFLGVPFNIASYALLTIMIAQVCRLSLGMFIHIFGDIHLYKNHIKQAKTQLARTPYPLPTLKVSREVKNIDTFCYDDFTLVNYTHHPAIPAPVAV